MFIRAHLWFHAHLADARDLEPAFVPAFAFAGLDPFLAKPFLPSGITEETALLAVSIAFSIIPFGCCRLGVMPFDFWNFAFSASIRSPNSSSDSRLNCLRTIG